MNRLRVEIVAGGAPSLHGLAEGTPWLDSTGEVCARIFKDGETRWIDWPHVGLFQFSPPPARIQAWTAPGFSLEGLTEFFHERLQPLLLQRCGLQALHASALQIGSVAIAFSGPSGCGKSTLAYAGALEGHTQIADDALVVDTRTTPPEVLSLPFRPRLRGAALELDPPMTLRAGGHATRLPLAAIVLLVQDTTGTNTPRIERMTGPSACVEVLAHAHVFDATEAGSLVFDYVALVDGVRVYRLTYPPAIAQLPRLVRTIEELAT